MRNTVSSHPPRAVIFDMDGLLIDSEPFWRKAEVEVFGELGVPLTEEMCFETLGTRIDGVIALWFSRYPWKGVGFDEVERRLEDALLRLIAHHGAPKEGVDYVFNLFEQRGIPCAIASSSSSRIIREVMRILHLDKRVTLFHSAEHEPQGKPHPDVYLSTLTKLGVNGHEALAFEDSATGVRAALAANIPCIWIPERTPEEDLGVPVLRSLLEFRL